MVVEICSGKGFADSNFLKFAIMKDEIKDTKSFLQELSEQLYIYISKISPTGLDWILHIAVKMALLVGIFMVLDLIFKIIINYVFRFFHNEEKFPVVKSVYQSRITNSVAHFVALAIFGSVHE